MDDVKNLFNKIINKIKKIGIKKFVLITIGIVFLIILVSVIGRYFENKIYEDKVNKTNYTSMDDFNSVREIVTYMGCKYISEDNSKDKNYSEIINLEFNRDLYDGDTSNQTFFENLSIYIANYLNYQNFVMVDSTKKIQIEVICDKENKKVTDMIINGDSNYFEEQDSKIQLKNASKINNTDIIINSNILKELINNKWRTSQVNFGTKESIFDKYDIYFDEGLEVRTVGTKVFNIVFTDKYKDKVVSSIRTGMEFGEIKDILGTPIFEENNVIGYKSKDIYIFFSEGQISVYRVEDFTEDGFSEFLTKIKEETDISKIANTLTELWPDYDERIVDKNKISITYSLRGVKLEYGVSNINGITIYSNYKGNIIDKKNIENIEFGEIPDKVYINVKEDLVKKIEEKRIANNTNDLYICDMTEQNNKEMSLNTISNKFSCGYTSKDNSNRLIFYSKDNQYPKYEIIGNITSYVWIDDYNVAYGIANEGIYILNLKNRKNKTLIKGNDKYKLKQYTNHLLVYDENKSISI